MTDPSVAELLRAAKFMAHGTEMALSGLQKKFAAQDDESYQDVTQARENNGATLRLIEATMRRHSIS